jgi:hypothetical protein
VGSTPSLSFFWLFKNIFEQRREEEEEVKDSNPFSL